MNVNVSDWVHGITGDGEMVYGFVESADRLQSLITLYVVKSDNVERERKYATVKLSTIKSVEGIDAEDLRHVDDLIDLALATRDEAWFMELTDGINTGQLVLLHASERLTQTKPNNRLGNMIG
ncbi:IDEAL domain-containing protein [Paenibacillus sp. strain BS8-2]